MADTGDTWLSQIDENEPDGSVRTVSVLDDHQRRHRKANRNTFSQEHSLTDGRHADVLNLGQDADTVKRILARVLAVNKPEIRYSITNSQWEISDDGTNFEPLSVFEGGAVVRAVLALATAPLKWTQDVSYTDRVLTFTGGAGNGTFGSVNPNNGVASVDIGGEHSHGAVTGSFAITTATMAAHRHKLKTLGSGVSGGLTGWTDNPGTNPMGIHDIDGSGAEVSNDTEPADVGGGATHNHTIGGSGTHAHNYNYDFSGRYVIACTLD